MKWIRNLYTSHEWPGSLQGNVPLMMIVTDWIDNEQSTLVPSSKISVWLTRETYGRVFLVISEWECDRADYGNGVWTKQLDQWPGDPYDGAGPNRRQWDRQTPLHRSRIHCTVYLCVGCPLQWVGHTGTAQEITVSGKRRMNFYSFKRSLYIWITRLVSFSLRDPYKSCGFYVIYRILRGFHLFNNPLSTSPVEELLRYFPDVAVN